MNYDKLTCTREQADELQKLGILSNAFLWWVWEDVPEFIAAEGKEPEPTGQKIRTWNVIPLGEAPYHEGYLPAWTKHEIDTMIGPGWPKPDFFEPMRVSKATNPLGYPIYQASKMLSFDNGAQASAYALIEIMKMGKIDPVKASERYYAVFKI
jgi:hypothetical protein